MKNLIKYGFLSLFTLGVQSAYAGECTLDYGIASHVTSNCTSFTFNKDFQGMKGQKVILACGLKSQDKTFAVHGQVMIVPQVEKPHAYSIKKGPKQTIGNFVITEDGPVNFKMDPATVVGEGFVACVAVKQGGVVIKPHIKK